MKVHLPINLIDAFVGQGCAGNLAGVILLDRELAGSEMQSIAARVGASETAFVFGGGIRPSIRPSIRLGIRLGIRWFTPTVEVGLCGHATLAAAHWLWENGHSDSVIEFESRAGVLVCRRVGAAIEMDFPEMPLVASEPEAGLFAALGIDSAVSVFRSGRYFLVEVASESTVAALAPDFSALSRLECDGVFVTSASSRCDFVSRCFFPKEGIPEDPVTGSAHCALGPYWRAKLSRDRLTARQISRDGGAIQISFKPGQVVLGGVARVRSNLI